MRFSAIFTAEASAAITVLEIGISSDENARNLPFPTRLLLVYLQFYRLGSLGGGEMTVSFNKEEVTEANRDGAENSTPANCRINTSRLLGTWCLVCQI